MTAALKGDVKKTPSDPIRNWAAGLAGAGEHRARCPKNRQTRNGKERDGGVGKKIFST